MPGTTQVPCHSGPGVRLHSWWMESFLTLILLILVLIPVLGLNLRLSVVLMMNLFFLIFVRQIPKVIQRQMDPPRLPLPQYDRHRKESSVQTREMLQDPRVKVREILLGPLSLVRAEGVATVEVHHPAAVAVDVEKATIVWIRSQVQIRCPMRIEITLKMP